MNNSNFLDPLNSTKLTELYKEVKLKNIKEYHPLGKELGSEQPEVIPFLKRLSYQPFDDWYKEFNRYIEGDMEDKNEVKNFYEDTQDIINFLKKIL